MKKGFTLIELLAVIVIIAIIALIAVPIVLGIINDSKNESGKSSVKLYMKSVEQTIIKKNYKTEYNPDECIIQETGKLRCYKDFEEYPEELEIEMNGVKPTNGTIIFENGKIKKIKYLVIGSNYYRYDDEKVIETQAPPKEAGLYDDNYNLLASWDELTNNYHLDINKNYTSSTYNDGTSGSMYNVLNNNEELKNGSILVVKRGISTIKDYAFHDCVNLKTIILPETILYIGSETFSQCINLEDINLPDSITFMGQYAFTFCINLESIIIPRGLYSIFYRAFMSCYSLKKVKIPNTIISIQTDAFVNCTELESIVIPDSVTNIDFNAFVDCTNLKSVKFENTSGWYITSSWDGTSGTNIDVTNASENATNLVNSYRNYYWKRN